MYTLETAEQELFAHGIQLHEQGTDWDRAFEAKFVGSHGGARHNVNVAQAIKSSGIWYRFSKNETLRAASLERMHSLDEWFGLPTGTIPMKFILGPDCRCNIENCLFLRPHPDVLIFI